MGEFVCSACLTFQTLIRWLDLGLFIEVPFMTATAHILFERILFLTGHGSEHVEENRRSKLSGREVEILRYTADGKTSQDISQLLDISERTVAFHINNILLKFSVPNKTAAVARAVVQGLI